MRWERIKGAFAFNLQPVGIEIRMAIFCDAFGLRDELRKAQIRFLKTQFNKTIFFKKLSFAVNLIK